MGRGTGGEVEGGSQSGGDTGVTRWSRMKLNYFTSDVSTVEGYRKPAKLETLLAPSGVDGKSIFV